MSRIPRIPARAVFALVALSILAACQGVPVEPPPDTEFDRWDQRQRDRFGTVTGEEDGVSLFSTEPTRDRGGNGEGGGGGGIGVNAFLWRASLDTIDFMPLVSADPFGGLIITDWLQPADTPDERVKAHIQILDTTLRADGVKVSVFRQVRGEEGGWLDAPVDRSTARALEDRILTRARELRIAQLEARS